MGGIVIPLKDCTVGDSQGGISDSIMRAFFAPRSDENRNALWALLSARWNLTQGERLARSWDGFMLAYNTFDPTRCRPGYLCFAFLRLVHLRCLDVKRTDRAKNGAALSLPIRSRLQVVRLEPDEWESLAALPEQVEEDDYHVAPSENVERDTNRGIPVQDTTHRRKGRKTHWRALK